MNETCVDLMRRTYTLREHAHQHLYPHNPKDLQGQISSQLESVTNGFIGKFCFFLQLMKHAPFKCLSEITQVFTELL